MTDAPLLSRRILLARRPKGAPVAEDFRLDEAPVPPLQAGEVLVRTIWLSLDPYMRGRMNDAPSYAPPAQLGDPMPGECVGQVEASRAEGIAVGDFVRGYGGWQSRFVLPGEQADQARPRRGAAEHGARSARHAGPHRLCRSARGGPGQGRGDGGRRCRERCRRRHCRPARQDRRLPCGGRGWRRRQVPLRRGRARLRRLPRPPRARPRGPAEGGLSRRRRRLYRAGRRRAAVVAAAAVQPACPNPGDRGRRLVQPTGTTRGPRPLAAIVAHHPGQAAAGRGHAGLRLRPSRTRVPPHLRPAGSRWPAEVQGGRGRRPGERTRGVHGHAGGQELRQAAG